MALTNITTLKSWFRRGLKPLQDQFWSVFDSFWHKEEKIPIDTITDLPEIINSLPSQEVIEALFASLQPEILTLSENGVYELTASRIIDIISFASSNSQTITLTDSLTGENLLEDIEITSNITEVVRCAIIAPQAENRLINISGVTSTLKLSIYKR